MWMDRRVRALRRQHRRHGTDDPRVGPTSSTLWTSTETLAGGWWEIRNECDAVLAGGQEAGLVEGNGGTWSRDRHVMLGYRVDVDHLRVWVAASTSPSGSVRTNGRTRSLTKSTAALCQVFRRQRRTIRHPVSRKATTASSISTLTATAAQAGGSYAREPVQTRRIDGPGDGLVGGSGGGAFTLSGGGATAPLPPRSMFRSRLWSMQARSRGISMEGNVFWLRGQHRE